MPRPSGPSAFHTRASPNGPPSSPPARSPISSSPSRSSPVFNYVNGRQVLEPRVEASRPAAPPSRRASSPRTSSSRSTAGDRQLRGHAADHQRERRRDPDVVVERGGGTEDASGRPRPREEQTTPFGKQRIGLLGLQASRDPNDQAPSTAPGERSRRRSSRRGTSSTDLRLHRQARRWAGIDGPALRADPDRQVSGQVATLGGVGGLVSLSPSSRSRSASSTCFPIPSSTAAISSSTASRPCAADLERPGAGDRLPNRPRGRRNAHAVFNMNDIVHLWHHVTPRGRDKDATLDENATCRVDEPFATAAKVCTSGPHG